MDANDISTFLLDLYAPIHEQNPVEYAHYVFTHLQRMLPFDSGYIVHSGRYSDSLGPLYDGVSLFQQPPEKLQEYASVKSLDTLAKRIFTVPNVVHQLGVMDVLPKQSMYHPIRAYAKTYSVHHLLGMALHDSRSHTNNFVGLSLARHVEKKAFTQAEARLFALLAPHIRLAHLMHRRWHRANAYPADQSAAQARMIADKAGCIVHADPEALNLLQKEWRQWEPPILPLALLLQHTYVGHHIEVQQQVIGGGALIFALKSRLCDENSLLTPAQWPIVQRMLQGMTHKEIAKALKLSDFTVRNHLTRVYKQTGTRNKVELLQLWHQGRLTTSTLK